MAATSRTPLSISPPNLNTRLGLIGHDTTISSTEYGAADHIHSECTTPHAQPSSPTWKAHLEFHEKRSRITLRALGANATYASLFIVFEIIVFTTRNLEPLWELSAWRRHAMLFSSLWAITLHLMCIFTVRIANPSRMLCLCMTDNTLSRLLQSEQVTERCCNRRL